MQLRRLPARLVCVCSAGRAGSEGAAGADGQKENRAMKVKQVNLPSARGRHAPPAASAAARARASIAVLLYLDSRSLEPLKVS